MPGGYGLGNYGGTWQHPSTRWEMSKEQRAQERSEPERKPKVENPPSMIPDRVPESERDGTGGRHFRDALHERFFGEACDFLDYNVDDLHVFSKEETELIEEQAEILRRRYEVKRRREDPGPEEPQRMIGIYLDQKGIWHPLVPEDPGFQELVIAASRGSIEVVYGQQENPEIEERLLSNRKT